MLLSATILLFFVSLAVNSDPLPSVPEIPSDWNSYVRTFSKSYKGDEEERKKIFAQNYAEIEAHNAEYEQGLHNYTLGVNDFTDLSTQEVVKTYTGVVVPPLPPLPTGNNSFDDNSPDQARFSSLATPPANFDWRTATPIILNPIRNQGSCGSCWAFNAIATVEGAFNKKAGALRASFSEQNLLDCSYASSYGCNGGWPGNAMAFLKTYGVFSSTQAPYTSCAKECLQVSNANKPNFFSYTAINDATLRSLVFNYGPVAVVIDASSSVFKSYRSGILTLTTCSAYNHAVNVVGYATTGAGAPFWILRNSWGTTWGEAGYFRLSANTPCLIKDFAWVAQF